MNEMIINKITISSLEVANQTGKKHSHVLRDIRKQLAEQKIDESKFGSIYHDAYEREKICFNLDQDQFFILASGYSIQLRAKLIKRWLELENKEVKQIPQNYKEALLELHKSELEIEAQRNTIASLKPHIDYLSTISKSNQQLCITQIAKEYGMSGTALNSLLHEYEVQYKVGGQWVLYVNYQDCNYTVTATHLLENGATKVNTKWTQKGRMFLYSLLKSKGILPAIEKLALTKSE